MVKRNNTSPSGKRIQNKSYTDADVVSMYMKYRENRIGPFTREVGDFIAHGKRDRGQTLESTLYLYSQFAFFQRHQSKSRKPIPFQGSCDWWFKSWLLNKIDKEKEKNFRKAVGISRSEGKKAVNSWFPEKDRYPTNINCSSSQVLANIVSFGSRFLVSQPVFQKKDVVKEIEHLFLLEGISGASVEEFIVATATILSGKKVEVIPGFYIEIQLLVANERRFKFEKGGESKISEWVPDGDLEIMVTTRNNLSDGIVDMCGLFLDTKIDTEKFFSRKLILNEQDKYFRLNLDVPLQYNSSCIPPVEPITD